MDLYDNAAFGDASRCPHERRLPLLLRLAASVDTREITGSQLCSVSTTRHYAKLLCYCYRCCDRLDAALLLRLLFLLLLLIVFATLLLLLLMQEMRFLIWLTLQEIIY